MKEELSNISEESLQKLEENLKDDARTVEDVRGFLRTTEKGKIKQSIENCTYIFEHDPLLSGAIRRNNLTGRIDLVKKMPWKQRGIIVTDTDINNLRLYLEKNYDITSEKIVKCALDIVANENTYNPIIEKLESLEWDGQERIATALNYFLGAEVNEYTAAVMQMHMLAAIHRLYVPGCKYDICLCVVGEQGSGKSTFFRIFAIEDEWFTDDLRRLDDDNIYRKMQGHWVIELSEMSATANAKSIEETKSFISRQKETYKIPYETHPEDRPRQCVFCGSSNDLNFLPHDRTGNRRFAPVLIHPELAAIHPKKQEKIARAYMLQMWAEAMVLYKKAIEEDNLLLTFTDEMENYVKELQKEFMPEDTEIGVIEDFLEKKGYSRVCIKMIYCEAMGHSKFDELPKWQSKNIAEILRTLGYEDIGSRKFEEYGGQKAWEKKGQPNMTTDDDGFMKVSSQMKLPFD